MSGLHFYKLDLHVHTPASRCYSEIDTPELIVQAAVENGLDGIAITDHNSGAWIDNVKEAAKETNLVIFPGVEISTSEGFHVVALFDPAKNKQHVDSLLSYVNIKPEAFGKCDAFSTENVRTIIDKIHEREGLAILAHIDFPKGLFFEQVKIKDNKKINVPIVCSKLLNEAHYDAVEIVSGKYPDGFDSDHLINRFSAFYQASDNPNPENPSRHSLKGIGSLYTLFKMESINLEGLRLCFSDPEVRICLKQNYGDITHPKVVNLNVGNAGFLSNLNIDFHEGLNSLIGGKGVGKSLIIEFLRFGLSQSPSDSDLWFDHKKKLMKRLEIGNTIQILYQDNSGTNYQVTRQLVNEDRDGNLITSDSCINLETGQEYKGDIPSLMPILAYSQTEVIKIAENKDSQLELIDRFIDSYQHGQDVASIQIKLESNDKLLTSAIQAQYEVESIKKIIDTLDAKINAIIKALRNPLFDEMKSVEKKKQLLETRRSYFQGFSDQVVSWKDAIVSSKLKELPEDLKSDKELSQLQDIIEKSQKSVISTLEGLDTKLDGDILDIAMVIQDWLPKYSDIYTKYQAELISIGGDLQKLERERIDLESEKTNLESRLGILINRFEGIDAIFKERNNLLNQLESVNLKFYEVRKSKYEELSALSDGKIQLDLDHAVNKTKFEEGIIEILKGGANPISLSDRRKIAHHLDPRRFIDLVLKRNVIHLANEADLSETWAERVIEKLWNSDDFSEVFAIQHNCYPTDVPSIKYRKEEGVYAELDELSVGQKCTALLIIALCEGSMPVVIDQPEDALDIASVWEDISKKLRRGKDARQFILTTHNSSVAVGGDSDKFIILKAGANSGEVIFTGAIDNPDVRQSVIDHLEGGNEPYNLRAKKYNLPN